jgi:hypothetical protein
VEGALQVRRGGRRFKGILRELSFALRRQIRQAATSNRLLPAFVIIGAQKGGTSSLYHYLGQHPHIAPALDKEVHFFDHHFARGMDWYRANFATSWYRDCSKRWYGHDIITGEASPYYLFYPHASERIASTLPTVKLIAMLRHPVNRAFSHYYHQVEAGRERLSFEDACRAEPERLDGEINKIMQNPCYESFNHTHFSYLSRGIYVDQLQAYKRHFPDEQMLILNSERFFADPAAGTRQVIKFLGLPDVQIRDFQARNTRRYPAMSPQTRTYLIDYFAPYNQKLYDFLGTRFDWDR